MKHASFVRYVKYNMMMGRSILKSFLLLFAFGLVKVRSEGCVSPLGMEDRRIKDSQITTSSVLKDRTPCGWQARLNQNISQWGAWCPDVTGGNRSEKNYDQYIQIDLLKLTKITGIATQGREYLWGKEYVRDYKIWYRRDGGIWYSYQEKDRTVKILQGNTDVSSVVRHNLDPAIMARYIRVHPGYDTDNTVCMRLELYGCVPVIGKDILSYSMPVGQTIKNGKVTFEDTSYNGVIENNICKDGTGILTDGNFGPDDAKQDKGKGWVGWSSDLTTSPYIDITFKFSGVRMFKDVTLTVDVDKKRSYAIFNRSEIFFFATNDGFSETSFLRYCPGKSVDSDAPYSKSITLSLCENTAGFIKLRLYFGGKWLLLTEISFNSVPASGDEKKSFQDCMKGACLVTQSSPTSSPVVPFTTSSTLTSECINCPAKAPTSPEAQDSSDSSNLQMTIIIICVILLIVILLLVIIFLLYRRRAFCFGKMKQRQKTDKNVHVELQNVESGHDVQYDKIDDNVGNPLYASVGGNEDDTHPMLSPVKKKENEFFPETDKRESELYSEPNMADAQPPKQEDYAEPVDRLQPTEDPDELLANPIYEGIYSEPLYGIAGTILVGPQEETLKRGYTMEKFPRDRLVFKEKIGDGQFGEVHIAEADLRDLNTQFGEEYAGKTKITVAVKTLKGDVKNDAKTDFFKEVRVMSRLQHENVVRLLAVCRDDPICMIVEYMENGDLNQFLKGHVLEDDDDAMIYANTKQPISYGELIYIASQVAAGMKYFAAMNFVHRDLAARNCLVGEGLTVKLADFGMSRLLYSKHYYRVQGRVMLPIRWMAPESIFQGRFTTQTDVWSFGITLWEIFTLAQDFPYPNLPDEQIIGNAKAAFKHGTGVIYNEKPDVCPQDVFDMMMLCWSCDPAQRPNFNTLYDFLMAKVGSVESAVV